MSVRLDYPDFAKAARLELAKREYYRRNLAELAERLKDFEYFAEYVSLRFGKKDYQHYPFSRYICRKYQKWAKEAGSRLRINLPPRVGKTENCVVLGILYIMCFGKKSSSIGYVTYGASLSKEKSQNTRTIYERLQKSDIGLYLGLSPINKAIRAKDHWATEAGFEMQAQGLGGSWIGREFDFIIMDDPYKDHLEALSPAGRRRVWLYWQGTVSSRLAPGARVLLIHTRWHEEDLSTQIEEHESFDKIVIAALAKKHDPLGRQLDQPLECRFTDQDKNYWSKVKKAKASYFWEGQYQQSPGDFIGKYFGQISIADWVPIVSVIGYLDTSFDGSDHVGLAIGGKLDKVKIQVEGFTWPGNVYDCAEEIKTIVLARHLKVLIIEKNADHGGFARALRKTFKDHKTLDKEGDLVPSPIRCKVLDETESTNKHARIVTQVYGNKDSLVYSSQSDQEFMNQIRRYDEGVKPCDAPDAVAGLIRRLKKSVKRFY